MPKPARAAALVVLLLAGALGSCGSEKADPAVARRERVEARLRATYSPAQAGCVFTRLDGRTIAALDRSRDLPTASPEFRRYSSALRACIVPDSTTTTPTSSTVSPSGP